MESTLVCQALTMGMFHRGYPSKVIVHSDRSGQYCSDEYQAILTAYNLRCSMSRKGNCWDNAVAKSFFHTLKTEWIYRYKLENIDQTKSMILWYIEAYYNRVRKHSHLNYLSPVQFENKLK